MKLRRGEFADRFEKIGLDSQEYADAITYLPRKGLEWGGRILGSLAEHMPPPNDQGIVPPALDVATTASTAAASPLTLYRGLEALVNGDAVYSPARRAIGNLLRAIYPSGVSAAAPPLPWQAGVALGGNPALHAAGQTALNLVAPLLASKLTEGAADPDVRNLSGSLGGVAAAIPVIARALGAGLSLPLTAATTALAPATAWAAKHVGEASAAHPNITADGMSIDAMGPKMLQRILFQGGGTTPPSIFG
jgi:hypothetical protein